MPKKKKIAAHHKPLTLLINQSTSGGDFAKDKKTEEIKEVLTGEKFDITHASYFIFGVMFFVGLIWFFKGPSDQELLANMAKAEAFHPWSGWWSHYFMGGGSLVPQLTTVFTILPLKFFGYFFGPLYGGKIAALLALCAAGFAMNLFLSTWSDSKLTGFFGAFAYMLGPQMSLRLGFNEHLPVVFSMVYVPLVLWSLYQLMVKNSFKSSLLLALSYGALLLTFSKIAICFAPIACCFLLFLIYEYRHQLKTSSQFAAFVLRLAIAGLLLIPLAIIPLLPLLREYPWLALFTFEPFSDWQNNFAIQSSLAFLDRDCLLTKGMNPNFNLDHGGCYLGIITILLAWYAYVFRSKQEKKLIKTVTASIVLLVFSAWLSMGPHSLISRSLLFLQSAQGLANSVIPLFWMTLIGMVVVVWQLSPSLSNPRQDKYLRVSVVTVLLFVPGFSLLELLPFAKAIRAPFSVWQIGGSLSLAILFGSLASSFIASFHEKKLQKILGATLLLLWILDFSPYLFCYYQGGLRDGTYDDFLKAACFLKQDTSGSSVAPFSGRYFYLQIPSLTGHPLTDEAFNRYFELKCVRALHNPQNNRDFQEMLNLLGASYLFIDKEDPLLSKQSEGFYRSLFPVAFENQSFLILENHHSLFPAFIARDFVVFPEESYSLAEGSLQLASINLLSLEMPEIHSNEIGFAGIANRNNQIELLPDFKEHGGLPFEHINSLDASLKDHQEMIYHVPANVSGWFVVTKAFHPDWRGYIDGQPSKIYRAAGALLALNIPLNTQEVIFKFTPPLWYMLCFYLGLMSWLLGLSAFFLFYSSWAQKKGVYLWNIFSSIIARIFFQKKFNTKGFFSRI